MSNQKPGENSRRVEFSRPDTYKFTDLVNAPQSSQNIELLELRDKVQALQNKVAQLENNIRHKAKRVRRKAGQIEKRYECEKCQKRYGSLVSLNLHLKLKHRTKLRQKAVSKSDGQQGQETSKKSDGLDDLVFQARDQTIIQQK